MNKGVLLFSGVNPRAVISAARYMTLANIPFHVVAMGAQDEIHATSYQSHVLFQRSDKQLHLELFEGLIKLLTPFKYDQVTILPTTEFLNRFLLAHREELSKMGFEIPLCNKDLYERISDKISFGEMCAAHGLLIPATLNEIPSKIPFVAKPRHYSVKNPNLKPILVHTAQAREELMAHAWRNEYYFQPFIEGSSHYLLYHIHNSSWMRKGSQENFIQQPDGGSIILAKSNSLYLEGIADDYCKMLVESGFEGLIMIELRKSGSDYYMIEANPRFWGPLQLTLDAHMDILPAFFASLGFQYLRQPKHTEAFYFWSGGFKKDNLSQLAYFGLNCDDLVRQIQSYQDSDIYNRPDTQKLFQHVDL